MCDCEAIQLRFGVVSGVGPGVGVLDWGHIPQAKGRFYGTHDDVIFRASIASRSKTVVYRHCFIVNCVV